MGHVLRSLGVAAFLAVALPAFAADVTLKSAWMRPAAAGAEAARAYVDIESGTTLDLVGASTPVAAKVLLVHVARLDDPESESVVPTMAVPAGTTTRLAYRGDHLRLVGIDRDLANGTPVPLTLLFRDAQGREVRATTQVLVRGLLLPQQIPSASRDAPSAPETSAAPTGTPRM